MFIKISDEKNAQFKKAYYVCNPRELLTEIIKANNGSTYQDLLHHHRKVLRFFKRSIARDVINNPVYHANQRIART